MNNLFYHFLSLPTFHIRTNQMKPLLAYNNFANFINRVNKRVIVQKLLYKIYMSKSKHFETGGLLVRHMTIFF